MTEILPCPNPECRGECRAYGESFTTVALWSVRCVQNEGCGYIGPHATSADEAIRLHNNLPREAEWVSVEEHGLPEPSRSVEWDVACELGSVRERVLVLDQLAGFGFATERRWVCPCGGANVVQDVTHYRIHNPPRGPKR